MKNLRRIITLLFLATMVLIAPSRGMADPFKDLVFLTENYAPFNYEKDGRIQGIAIDLLLQMFERAGSAKGLKDIKVMNWARGYNQAQNKKNTVLFSTTRVKSREKMFKWVGPITINKISLIARKDRKISIGSDADLNKFKIGAIRDDIGEILLLEKGVDKKSIYRTNSSETTANMLAAGRIDLWAYGDIVAMWNLQEIGQSQSDFEVVRVLRALPLYFAVQKDTDDTIVGELQAALNKVMTGQ